MGSLNKTRTPLKTRFVKVRGGVTFAVTTLLTNNTSLTNLATLHELVALKDPQVTFSYY